MLDRGKKISICPSEAKATGARGGREGDYARGDLVDVELDAVAGEDEHLAVEGHGHPVPEQLRVLRHLSGRPLLEPWFLPCSAASPDGSGERRM